MHLLLFLFFPQVAPADLEPNAIIRVSKNCEVEAFANGKGYLKIGSELQKRIAPLSKIKEHITIPRNIKDGESLLYINRISHYAFFNTSLKSITLPEDIRELGNYSFAYTPLTKINLSHTNVEEIPWGCFANSSLKHIDLPSTLYRVVSFAFDYTKIEVFEPYVNLKYIEPNAFSNCFNLTIANLSWSMLTKLDPLAFHNCPALKQIWMSQKLTTVLYRTFANTEIDYIKIPKTLQKLESEAFAYSGFLQFDFSECKITEIPPKAFYGCRRVEKITLSRETTIIRANAFAECAVSEIKIFSALETIEEGCFCNTSKLKSLDLSQASVKTIPKDAFRNSNCGNLDLPHSLVTISDYAFANGRVAHVTFGTRLDEIGKGAFQNCLKLYSVNLSATNVKFIQDFTFDNCFSMSALYLPISLESIGYRAFYGCNFQELHLPTNIREVNEFAFSSNGKLKFAELDVLEYRIIHKSTFENCTALENVKLPSNLNAIKQSAFKNTKISYINIPNGVSSISSAAFACCAFLRTFEMNHTEIQGIEQETFANCTRLTSIFFSPQTVAISDYAFMGCALRYVNLPPRLGMLGIYSFSGISNLKKIDLRKTLVVKIPEGCFSNCPDLIEVKLPFALTNIDSKAFEGCSSMNSIYLNGTNVTSLPSFCFFNCLKLDQVKFPPRLEVIGQQCFAFTNMKRLKPPSSLRMIKKFAFYNAQNLYFANLSQTRIDSISEGMFLNCTTLFTAVLPINVESIENEAFALTNISQIIFPQTLRSIGIKCFYGCEYLSKFCAEYTSVNWIPDYALCNCKRLRKIEISQNIQLGFGKFAFAGTGLRNYAIPQNVMHVGVGCFAFCTDLVYFDISRMACNVSASMFEGCINFETIVLPQTLMEIGSRAFISTAIDSFIAPPAMERMGSGAFGNCPFLKEVDLRYCKISNIPAECFAECKILKTVIFAETISTIGSCAFMGTSLIKTTLPVNVFNIERALFKDCLKLKSVSLQYTTITSIPYQCFAGCRNLKEVLLPESITSVGVMSFAETKLKSIVLPINTNLLGSSAFMSCKSMTKADLSRTNIEALPEHLFSGCDSLVEVSLPILLTDLDVTCFHGCKALKVIEYCGYGRHTSGTLPIRNGTEIHVKMDFTGKKLFGVKVMKGYYCGTAPDPTPRPTDTHWEMPPQEHPSRMMALIVLYTATVVIIATYALIITIEKRREGYSLLQS